MTGIRGCVSPYGFVLAFVCLMFASGSAKADSGWRICNHTSYIAEVAVGRPLQGQIAVRGWLRLRPGECRQAVPAPLVQSGHYMFARSSRAHTGGLRQWGGDVPLCVRQEGSFSLAGSSDCSDTGYDIELFARIEIGHKGGWTTRLLEIGDYNLGTAQAAGIQRLLIDTGATSAAIDGFIGRRTRRQISRFIRDRRLPVGTSDRDLIDVLEADAIERARQRGMKLCNRTDVRIWAAVAHLRDGQWESRGWWDIAPERCVRVLDHELMKGSYYVLAQMRAAEGIRSLAGASHKFCVSSSRFIIEGRRACSERFYDTALFAQTGQAQDNHLMVELFEEDFVPVTPGN